VEEPEYDPDDVDVGPLPAPSGFDVEPEYSPDEFDAGVGDDVDLPPFPTTHELVLKDHTKVISALTLDPSGARVLSGSHDYDCKLWDFGGMDHRCKPFKTWEPAGSYYVSPLSLTYVGHSVNIVVDPRR
jgi:WD repeat-containing protein 70